MVSEKHSPLTTIRNLRCPLEDFNNRTAILLSEGHEQPRHNGKVVTHMELIPITEILDHILRPLIGFSKQQGVGITLFNKSSQCPKKIVRLRQVFAVSFFSLEKVRSGIYSKSIDAKLKPERNNVEHRLAYFRIVVVEIGLMTKKAMPVESPGLLIPGPIRTLSVREYDPCLRVFLIRVAPNVPMTFWRIRRASCLLKPAMAIGGLIDDEVRYNSDSF